MVTYDSLERAFDGIDRRMNEARINGNIQRLAQLTRSYRRLCVVWREFHDAARIP